MWSTTAPPPPKKQPTKVLKLLEEGFSQTDFAFLENGWLNATDDTLHSMHRLWVDLEGRRRILLASFVLDIQHSTWFQQVACSRSDFDRLYIPHPCSTEAWDCRDVYLWRDLMSRHVQVDLRFLANLDIFTLPPMDAFQSSILSCYQVHQGFSSAGQTIRGGHIPWYQPPLTHFSQTFIMHHALLLSSTTPIHTLLIVSNGSWLFNTKVTERSVWDAAKIDLRAWVTTDEAARSVWHANQVLRLALGEESLCMLQEQWCMYLAALVCWAYGLIAHPSYPSRPVPDAITVDVAEAQAWEYLSAMNVESWEAIPQVSIRWQTRGVLECVRARISGPLGGLLNQAEDVLTQLVEDKRRYWEF